jgi:hypothetical protein
MSSCSVARRSRRRCLRLMLFVVYGNCIAWLTQILQGKPVRAYDA